MKVKRELTVFCILGFLYLNVEIFARAGRQELTGLVLMSPLPIQPLSLAGWTSVWMFFIGGFAGWLAGFLDTLQRFAGQKLWVKMLACGASITAVELVSGLLLNAHFELALWDYSHVRYNLFGQISVRSAIAFTTMAPFVLWLNNLLRSRLFDEPKRYRFPAIYRDVVLGK